MTTTPQSPKAKFEEAFEKWEPDSTSDLSVSQQIALFGLSYGLKLAADRAKNPDVFQYHKSPDAAYSHGQFWASRDIAKDILDLEREFKT